MVYGTALLFGNGLPVLTEEDKIVEMIGNYFFHLTSPGLKSSARRGSIESCEETENHSPCKLFTDINIVLLNMCSKEQKAYYLIL